MTKKQRHILIIRLSALGDIVISIPLIKEYARKNPKIQFSVLSPRLVAPLFEGVENLHFIPFDIQKEKKSIWDIIRFARGLRKLNITEVADIHNVHRSRILRYYLQLYGIPNKVIFKNRKTRKQLIRKKNKIIVPLKTSLRKYEEVFVALKLKDLRFAFAPVPVKDANHFLYRRIGIAPFAKHAGKCWPLEYMEEVIQQLSADPNNKILLFGGGTYESGILSEWMEKYPNTESVAGKHTLAEEQEFIKSLDVMVSMDSANMHLASLAYTPVISIWGATHPYAGFYGWGQNPENAIQANMPCRPCSIFGNKKCLRNDYACLYAIKPEKVLQKIFEVTGGNRINGENR